MVGMSGPAQSAGMHALGQALSVVGLLVGALGYALLIRRRGHARKERDAVGLSGLRGLVRVMSADHGVKGRHTPE